MSEPDTLTILRDLQDRQQRVRRMTFGEWSREVELRKARGQALPQGGFGPGTSMMGHLNTSSRAPSGPVGRPSGEQLVGWKGPNYDPRQYPSQFGVQIGEQGERASQYTIDRLRQPPNWIDDVDMQNIWYSPFQPVWPFGPPYYTRPREWNFPVGYNLNYIPERMALYGMLRGMRTGWGVLATVIETRKDQLLRLPWTIQRKDKPKSGSKTVDQMRRFFRRPDGKLSYGQWSRKLLDDVFVTDSPCIYIDRGGNSPFSVSRGEVVGPAKHAEVLDGATIFPLIDDAGRRPDTEYEVSEDGVTYVHRQPAFQQIIYGLPMVNLSEDELIYAMMRPRPELPMFGFSPVEQILNETTEAIRKTFYQLEFWRSGSMPELIITVPETWTPRQIAMFQGHFDALLSGQLTLKSKVRFVPGGMKPFDIKNASGESLWSQRDELLVRLACYAFSVSPTPFVRQMNRGTAQNAQQTAQEEGLYPLMSWWKDDIMDRLIQDVFGYDDVEFVFLPRPEVDLEKQSKIHQVQVDEGLRTRNEVREQDLGLEPIEGGDQFTVRAGNTVVPLEMILSGQALAPGTPGAPPSGSSQGKQPGPQKTKPSQDEKASNQPMRGASRPEHASTLPSVKKLSYSEITDIANEAEKPTKGQKEAGNYKKGKFSFQGLPISIETPKGKHRKGHEPDGTKWKSQMAGHYGYIRGTMGADGDQIDVCIGKHPKSRIVFVIDQYVIDNGSVLGFDEHKVMLGYKKPAGALRDYYDSNGDGLGPKRAQHMTEMTMGEFRDWLKNGNKHKPISVQGIGALVKADTISTSTNLLSYDQTVPVRRKKKKKAKKRRMTQGPRWLQLNAQ